MIGAAQISSAKLTNLPTTGSARKMEQAPVHLSDQLSGQSAELSGLLTCLAELERIIDKRKNEKADVSYTARLHQAGLAKMLDKLGEELAELMVASCLDNDKTIVNEAADACYHLLVLASYLSITTEDLDLANQIESYIKADKSSDERQLLVAASTSWARLLWAITESKDKTNSASSQDLSTNWVDNQVVSSLQQLLAKIILVFAGNNISFTKLSDELRSRMHKSK